MNWREQGRVPLVFWTTYLDSLGSPLANTTCWIAAGDHSRFLLAVLVGESRAGTRFNRNRPENRNALNLRPPLNPDGTRDPGDYMSFAVWADGIQTGRERITSTTYGRGIYAETTTVLEFAHVWAPASDDNDPAAFARLIEQRIASYPREQEEPMTEQIVFGRVPEPGNMVDDFVDKPEGRGWSNYGERRLLGVFLHAVKGYASGTGGYFRTYVASQPNGGHGYNALTDWGVCGEIDARVRGAVWDGRIMNWNDPDGRGRFRSPWASGGDGSKGITGDVVPFVNTYGQRAINQHCEAIELSLLNNNDPVSAKMLASTIALAAWRVDTKGRIPYTQWPRNNDGLHMIFSHYEAGKTSCHIPDSVFAAVIGGVEATLKRWQVVSLPDAPEPEQPDPLYPPGMSPELAAVLWDGPDGALTLPWASRPFAFDPERAECQFWLERGQAQLKPGERWDKADWPPLINVVRRFKDKSVHAYVWASGPAFEKQVRERKVAA